MSKASNHRTSICIAIFLIAGSGKVSAQINNIYGSGNEVLRVSKYAEVVGSPYLYPDLRNGTIQDRTGKETAGIQLRYDTYSDLIEISMAGATMVADPSMTIKFTILPKASDSRRIFRNGFVDIIGGTQLTYYEILLDTGSVKFLKKTKTIMSEEGAGYGGSGKLTRFSSIEKYYLMVGNNVPVGVKLNRKSFVKESNLDARKMEDYLNRSENRLKTESDFINLLEFCAAEN